MTPEEFVEAVRDANATALSRLGSSKSLYADTEGEMEPDAVLSAAADTYHHAAGTLAAWADGDGEAADVFAGAAGDHRDHYETVTAELGDHDPGPAPAVASTLDGFDDTVARLGGLVGYAIVAGEKAGQTTGFFTGQADPGTASTFRSLRAALEAGRDRAATALAEACADDEDWTRAEDAASDVVQAAYDEYTQRLESMGVNPKPVC